MPVDRVDPLLDAVAEEPHPAEEQDDDRDENGKSRPAVAGRRVPVLGLRVGVFEGQVIHRIVHQSS